jgi:branched-chain amino acid transport system substrate-binding protein
VLTEESCVMSKSIRNTWRAAGLAGLLAAVSVTAGCGSSGSDTTTGVTASSNGAATTGAATSTATGTPIKLVALIDNTGPTNGRQGDSIPVLQAWVKDANASGGAAGHPVSVDVEDTQGNASKAAADVQKVIADKSVVGVIVVDALTEDASLHALSKAGVPVIGGVAYDPSVWGATKGNTYLKDAPLPGVYEINTAFPASISAWITAAQQNHLKRMISINFSAAPPSKQSTDLANAMAAKVGIAASSITIDATAPNFTADCLKIIQSKADYVIFSTPPDLAGRVIGDCSTQGYTGAYGSVGGGVTSDVYAKVGNNKLIGALWAFPWYTDSPASKQYASLMKANNVPTTKWQGAPGPVVWTTLELFRHTLEANKATLADTVTRENVLAAYGTVKNETLGGMMPGPVTYAPGDMSPPACYWAYTYQNGKFSGSPNATCPAKAFGVGG